MNRPLFVFLLLQAIEARHQFWSRRIMIGVAGVTNLPVSPTLQWIFFLATRIPHQIMCSGLFGHDSPVSEHPPKHPPYDKVLSF